MVPACPCGGGDVPFESLQVDWHYLRVLSSVWQGGRVSAHMRLLSKLLPCLTLLLSQEVT